VASNTDKEQFYTYDTAPDSPELNGMGITSRQLRRWVEQGDPDALFWPARANGSRRLDYTRNIDCGSRMSRSARPSSVLGECGPSARRSPSGLCEMCRCWTGD
jgi:hypothetical protein